VFSGQGRVCGGLAAGKGVPGSGHGTVYRVMIMSRACELTGKKVQYGNNVSHANNKTRRRFLPNLCNVTLISDALERGYRLRISAHALRSVEHRGGLDAFLLKADAKILSPRARLLRQKIVQKQLEKAA